MLKCCAKCSQEKAISEFYLDKHHSLGVATWCKTCKREWFRRWAMENPEKEKACIKRWAKKHHEKVLDYSRKWRRNNIERARKQDLEGRAKLLCQCLDHYGRSCAFCGSIKNLGMDHIGGNKGDSPKWGRPLWSWIIKNNFPVLEPYVNHVI